MPQTYVIIVAAGTGSRFGSDTPKQFLPMGHDRLPVVMHTIQAFRRYGIPLENIFLILSEPMMSFWAELCEKHSFSSPKCIAGGSTRFQSVKNALTNLSCDSDARILIHDGVRPLVDSLTIAAVVEKLDVSSCVVPVVPETNSLRRLEADGSSQGVDRSLYRIVQTPQGFRADLIKKAYQTEHKAEFTDDASVAEAAGNQVQCVPGNVENIKITNSIDLKIAELLLSLHSAGPNCRPDNE